MASGTIQKNMVLLWTNPSPTNNFNAQSINVDLSNYDALLIIYYYGTQSSNRVELSSLLPVNNITKYICISSGTNVTGGRKLSYDSSTKKITFESASYNNATNNSYIIPVYIYGLKL